MFQNYNFFIILYTNDGTENQVEHMAGFSEPPTIIETHEFLTDAIDKDRVPHKDKSVFMCQMTAEQAQQVFMGS